MSTRPQVHGLSLTPPTQCVHYNTPLDIIAIKHKCCLTFYACISCHAALADHPPQVWSKVEREEKAVLCGKCEGIMSIQEYMDAGDRCGNCGEGTNPGCKGHWGLYFEV
ncbi:zinc finger CHY protein [Glarea lozoyensis ATCC 20868]|uniref:Zinc finger CHY protein n=1 Tax=Glarea lozoyensis (strain ATCC 20868 / MF5171) TaxID=1116229 RepID=S3CTG8_GLAL2|nr:zinc finger CHY protein [Glarea lozoyensis ATCC 20868]EPE28314.1 zinc finger CHY protein [Glarea lozoyensis ATCC 20868]